MDAADGVWGAVVALIGLVSVVYTGRRGPKETVLPGQAETDLDRVGAEHLQVSPAIWQDMQGQIRKLEKKVDHLTVVVEQGTVRERTLREHLRVAMRIIRRANRRLRGAGQPEEPVPVELIPYSLD